MLKHKKIEESTKIVNTVIFFLILTFTISTIFMGIAISAGSLKDVNRLVIFGGMWSPGIAALLTSMLCHQKISEFGWGWGKTKYQILSFCIPFLYVGLINVIVWGLGMVSFRNELFSHGTQHFVNNVIFAIASGIIFALGEEIGWSGFFVGQIAKITTYTKTSFARGLIWSIWHFPLIIGGVYGPQNVPIEYKLLFFTITMTGLSFAFTWIRLKSGSLYTGMFMHASHNFFFQYIFNSLTVKTAASWYLIDEFGVVSAAVAVVVAVIFWSKRQELYP